ncbi:hypothetical protein LAC50_002849 [Escherichia coli]|nr:hypothetical protein [Escherichia coli]HCB8192068.1 hypothetical protein [Escherichia coli]
MTDFNAQPSVVTRSGTVHAPNLIHKRYGWHLSYCGSSAAYGCKTTALVIDNRVFFVLKGDHRREWMAAMTLWEALQYFVAHDDQVHPASEHLMALGLKDDPFRLMPVFRAAVMPKYFNFLWGYFAEL